MFALEAVFVDLCGFVNTGKYVYTSFCHVCTACACPWTV